jgi:hypothetical protein
MSIDTKYSTMNDEELQLLADRLAADGGMAPGEATVRARTIAGFDSDIRGAALEWARSGVMPDSPVVEGEVPSQLNNDYYAVQVFNLLDMFRKDKARTLHMLRHFPGRREVGPDSAKAQGLTWPQLRLREIQSHFHNLSVQAQHLYDEAVAAGLDSPLVDHLKTHSELMRKVTDDFHDALLTDEDKQQGAVPRANR